MIDKASAVLVKAKVLPLLNEHMETAFKLTERNETHLKNTAFEWFIAVISHCPTDFWSQVKPAPFELYSMRYKMPCSKRSLSQNSLTA